MVTETYTATLVRPVSRALGIFGALGLLSAFASTIATFFGIEGAGTKARLVGADVELGYPSSALAMLIFVIVLSVSAAMLSGAILGRGWWNMLICLAAIGMTFEVWVLYLNFSAFACAQLVFFAAVLLLLLRRFPGDRPSGLGVFLVLASTIGFFAAFRLTIDKVGTFTDPTSAPSCNFSVIVQCGKNLSSWQGSLFGFPNPLIGIGGWMSLLLIGIMIVSGLTFARWFWICMNIGALLAIVFVGWLVYQSIFALGTLCPWCMVTWSVAIPTFWLITLHNLKTGVIRVSEGPRRFFAGAYTYVPLVTLLCYLVIAGVAQAHMNLLQYI